MSQPLFPADSVPRRTAAEVVSPADGLPPDLDEPMESVHAAVVAYLLSALRWLLRDRDDACVEMELPVQWDPDDLRVHVMPDVFVSLGVPARPRERRSYATWVEGKGLDLVIEITSESTVNRDLGKKLAAYRDHLDVREYVLFDPRGEWLKPRFQLFRREGDELRAVEGVTTSAPLALQTIDADLVVRGTELLIVDRRTGEEILDHEGQASARLELEERLRELEAERTAAENARRDAEDARRAAEVERTAAEDARRAAEEKAARLEAELRRLRGEGAPPRD